MNENSRASGIVSATMTAARTLTRKKIRTTSTSTMPRSRLASTGIGRQMHQIAAVIKRPDFDVPRQDVPVQLLRLLL